MRYRTSFALVCASLLCACFAPDGAELEARRYASVTSHPAAERQMPSTPYAKLLVTVNGGAPVSGAIYPALGDTILLRGESTVGWTQQKFELYDYPVGMALPAGWTNGGDGTYYYATDPFPPSFTTTPWGKYMLRLTVNNGLNGNGAPATTLTDESTALSVVSANTAVADLGFLEDNQFSASREWTGDQKANLRLLDSMAGVASHLNAPTWTAPTGLLAATIGTVYQALFWRNTTGSSVTLTSAFMSAFNTVAPDAVNVTQVKLFYADPTLLNPGASQVQVAHGDTSAGFTGQRHLALTFDQPVIPNAMDLWVQFHVSAGAGKDLQNGTSVSVTM